MVRTKTQKALAELPTHAFFPANPVKQTLSPRTATNYPGPHPCQNSPPFENFFLFFGVFPIFTENKRCFGGSF